VSAPPQPVAVPNRIYTAGDADVTPPVIERQRFPNFPANAVANVEGVLEVIINEAGTVDAAVMRSRINPRYDSAVVVATRSWRFKPATVGGTPVKYRKLIRLTLEGGS
jgi:TonB family protein